MTGEPLDGTVSLEVVCSQRLEHMGGQDAMPARSMGPGAPLVRPPTDGLERADCVSVKWNVMACLDTVP